jgi:hypothetical protein
MDLQIFRILISVITIAIGLIGLPGPKWISGFTGLKAHGPRGVTEIRTVLGGLFVALGAAPLILNDLAAYRMLGIVYATLAGTRGVSMLWDRSIERSNVLSFVLELAFGVVLLI